MKSFTAYLVVFFAICSINANAQGMGAEAIFKNNYKAQKIDKFNGTIALSGDTGILYNNELLKFKGNRKFMLLFTLGILYPEVINKVEPFAVKKQKKVLAKINIDTVAVIPSSTIPKEVFNDLFGTKNLSFGDMEELYSLNIGYKIKRFKFWLFRKGFLNPTEYFFELTNKKADEDTDFNAFISGAQLTFIKEGSIII